MVKKRSLTLFFFSVLGKYNSSKLHLNWDENIPLQIQGVATSLAEFDVLSIKSESSYDDVAEDTEADDGKFILYSCTYLCVVLSKC